MNINMANNSNFYVIKRSGEYETISFDKVLYRIKSLCALPEDMELLMNINPEKYKVNKTFKPLFNIEYNLLAKETIGGIYPGVTTKELDELAANIAQPLSLKHPEYGILSSRILISNHHKNTIFNLFNHFSYIGNLESSKIKQNDPIILDTCNQGNQNNLTIDIHENQGNQNGSIPDIHGNSTGSVDTRKNRIMEDIEKNTFLYVSKALFENNDENGNQYPLLAPDIYKIILKNYETLEKIIDYNRDYDYDYMGFKMLEETYLQKCSLFNKNGDRIRVPIERPQDLIMRVALGIHCSEKYRDFNKLRQNDFCILNEIYDILVRYLNFDSLEKIKKAAQENKIIWRDIIQMIREKIPCVEESGDDLEKITSVINKNTLTWNELLNSEMLSAGEITPQQLEDISETYELMSKKFFIHATPTLFNSGTLKPQLSSCFLIQLKFDSLKGITNFWEICAEIAKWAGGIGSHIHLVRCKGSYIRGTNGKSNGLVYMLKVLNDESVYVDQGGNKRPGSHAVYLELWHGDIFDVISLKKNRGNDAERARNLFYAMWISDEFMRTIEYEFKLEAVLRNECVKDHGRVTEGDEKRISEEIKSWYLMCPDNVYSENKFGYLSNLYDENYRIEWIPDEELFDPEKEKIMKKEFAFTYAYRSCIRDKKYVERVSAIALWKHICEVIGETGVPYMVFKDSCNRKSNQKNLGTIKSSNLCTEIVQYSNVEEIAVCNLTSINFTSFLVDEKPTVDRYWGTKCSDSLYNGFDTSLGMKSTSKKYIDWNLFERILRRQVKNLNKVIDINYYPVNEAQYSNMKHRPMAIGTQDFANLLTLLRLPFDSPEAMELNFYLYEFMYYITLDESCNESIRYRDDKIQKLKEKIKAGKPNTLDELLRELTYYKNNSWSGAYDTFVGCPASKGELQFDLWIKEQKQIGKNALRYPLSLNWDLLKSKIKKHGIRNSLLIGLMPTGSTSTILGCSPAFEPHNGLIMKRKNKTGEHIIIHKQLQNDLISLGLWSENIKNKILKNNKGSISEIDEIPKKIRDIYKTVWDMSPKITSEMCLIRGVFVDQSQSYTVFMRDRPTVKNLTQFHFYNWKNGAKTSSYYTRRLAVADASKLQVETLVETPENKENEYLNACSKNSDCKVCES